MKDQHMSASNQALQLETALAAVQRAVACLHSGENTATSSFSAIPASVFALFGSQLTQVNVDEGESRTGSRHREALRLCLLSSMQLLTVSRALLQEENCPVTLIMDAKDAGRVAYQAALLLVDKIENSSGI